MSKCFQSLLASELEAFLTFKIGLGHSYKRKCYTLRSFDRYVAEHHRSGRRLDMGSLINGWLAEFPARKSITVATHLTPIRQFCLFRRRFDPKAFVPERGWPQASRRCTFLPVVLSSSQVAKLIRYTHELRDLPLRRRGFRLLICILYSCGLRLGEALRLHIADVHWQQRSFFIRLSKGRSRWVPFHADVGKELRKYLRDRQRYVAPRPESYLLCHGDGSAYSVFGASRAISGLMRRAGLKPPKGRIGPRPHDLRHAFARERLRRWYQSGADLQKRLPYLSVYLGHLNLLGTEHYLKASPDLLALASNRMAARFRRGHS
jgi:integrase/recombinase XerD